ncbi:HAMP domain-containing sensor histidine kinase [Paenibacillus glacialis]|uniref:histidine kinase n=1 Tax=Paenibacillus glacialis TaxID=494026 RepID=A0A168N451_9BACL|nr:HAMP domain-containing sensor histidine kinase [Paenibacillus glacialis]OAB45369.1 two-component sensor histidine kinase [Paenibacillus glacialis]
MKNWFIFRFGRSLLSRYLLIVIVALLMVPIIITVPVSTYGLVTKVVPIDNSSQPTIYERGNVIEAKWHQQALRLDGASEQDINLEIHHLKGEYPEATMFWVDSQGYTRLEMPQQQQIPVLWTVLDAITFMKSSIASDPFTVVSFIGGGKVNAGQGFMTVQIPRDLLEDGEPYRGMPNSYYVIFGFILFIMFIVVSWLFFARFRKRLLRLQSSMTLPEGDGIPEPVIVNRHDEIGQLEDAFNHMVVQLRESMHREREEEDLRKQLIAHLSHDLRTPLTVIRSHIYSLQKERLSAHGVESLQLIDAKIHDLSGLIDNLLSYNLLTSGRYTLMTEKHDVLRLVRESAAAWYPLWEKEGFEVDVNIQEEPLVWNVDEGWFRRIVDNIFQNVVRHARSGEYIGVYNEIRQGEVAIVIADHGEGMSYPSDTKGVGIGLAIVEFLTSEMGLKLETISSSEGTRVYLYRLK